MRDLVSIPTNIGITGWARLIRSHSSARFCLQIKSKFELTVHFKHEMIEKIFTETGHRKFECKRNF